MWVWSEEVYKLNVLQQLTKIVHFPVLKLLEGIKMLGHIHTHTPIIFTIPNDIFN